MAASMIEALPEGEERREGEVIAKNCAAIAYAGLWFWN